MSTCTRRYAVPHPLCPVLVSRPLTAQGLAGLVQVRGAILVDYRGVTAVPLRSDDLLRRLGPRQYWQCYAPAVDRIHTQLRRCPILVLDESPERTAATAAYLQDRIWCAVEPISW